MTIKAFLTLLGSIEMGFDHKAPTLSVKPALPVAPTNLRGVNITKKKKRKELGPPNDQISTRVPWFSNRNQTMEEFESVDLFAPGGRQVAPPRRKCGEGSAVQLCPVANAEANRLTPSESTSIRDYTGLLDRHLRLSVQHGERRRHVWPAPRWVDAVFAQFNGVVAK